MTRKTTPPGGSGGLPRAAWFAALGRPLTAAQRRGIAAMIAAYPLATGDGIVVLADWPAVATALQAIDRDDAWWDYEEGEREAVWSLACQRYVEDDLAARLATARAADSVALGVALERALPAAAGEAALRSTIVGMAALAAHQHALATLAGVPQTHAFHRKFRLFAGGRLPLGYHAGRYLVY